MEINQHNYEHYFLMYIDNELSGEERAAVNDFIMQYPNYANKLEALQQLKISPDTLIYENKFTLYKLSEQDEQCIAYLENEMTSEEKASFENKLSANIALQSTVKQWQGAFITPPTTIEIAPNFKNSLYKVAGKTGTALVANGNKGYADKIYQSSFAGYFPADNPQYTIVVNIKNKPHAYPFYGASVAGPVFKEIADRLYVTYIQNKIDKAPSFNLKDSQLFNYTIAKTSLKAIAKQLSMPYQDSTPINADWANVQGAGRTLKAGQELQMASDSTMPNIKGMKLKDALWLCEKKGLIVKCSGKGKVVRQSILQGQYIQRGQQIFIELN